MKLLYDDDWLLQHDNASSDASRKTPEFLESKGVCVLGWPSNSPDFNVIKNCWHVLSKNIHTNSAANNLADLRGKVNSAIETFNNQ